MSEPKLLQREEIEALRDAATAGPWHAGHMCDPDHSCNCRGIVSECYAGGIAEILVDNGLSITDGGNDAPPLAEAIGNARLIASWHDVAATALHAMEGRALAAAVARMADARAEDAVTPLIEKQAAERMRERCIQVLLGGNFLHDKAPPALWAKDVVALIKAIPTTDAAIHARSTEEGE